MFAASHLGVYCLCRVVGNGCVGGGVDPLLSLLGITWRCFRDEFEVHVESKTTHQFLLSSSGRLVWV